MLDWARMQIKNGGMKRAVYKRPQLTRAHAKMAQSDLHPLEVDSLATSLLLSATFPALFPMVWRSNGEVKSWTEMGFTDALRATRHNGQTNGVYDSNVIDFRETADVL
jgi:hypothetical protein